MPNYYVNSTQTKETRHIKYLLCRLVNEPPKIARQFRDCRWTTVSRYLGILGHTQSEINAMLEVAKEVTKRCKIQD